MDVEIVDFIEVEQLDGGTENLADSRIDSSSAESIRFKWIPSAEAKHRLRMDQSEFVRAISRLIDEYEIPQSELRRGKARNTEYSEIAISLVEALESGNEEAFDQLKADFSSDASTEEVSVVAPVKFKQNADEQMASSDLQILDLRQTAQLKLTQLKQLYVQWQEAENAEKMVQEKDLEVQQVQWDLDCIDEVVREETYKKTRKREIKQMLKSFTEAS
jgi:hypothetical protein